jgi:ATP-dependent Clp protease ATP-binding subunit ClpC
VAEELSEAVRRLVGAAEAEARTLRHDHIGTEHLLLAVLSEPQQVGARALAAFGLTLADARAQVMRAVGLPADPSPPQLPITPPARDALAGALREAIELGRTTAAAEHVLLALLRERDGVGVRVLVGAGVDPRRLREAVRALSEAAAVVPAGPREAAGAAGGAAGEGHHGEAGAFALLGILAAGGPAAELLRRHGIDESSARGLLDEMGGVRRER